MLNFDAIGLSLSLYVCIYIYIYIYMYHFIHSVYIYNIIHICIYIYREIQICTQYQDSRFFSSCQGSDPRSDLPRQRAKEDPRSASNASGLGVRPVPEDTALSDMGVA